MSEKVHLMIINSHLESKLRYGVQFYSGERQTVINKYHQMKMKLARWAKDSYYFKISIFKICKSLKWETPSQEILKETVKFFHQCMIERGPKQILKKIRLQRTRQKAKISMKHTLNNELYEKT